MIIEELKNIKSTRKELRNFGLVVGGVLTALGLLLLYFGRDTFVVPLVPGVVLVVLGLVWPYPLLPLQKVWMAFAVIMNWVMTRVILSVVFYLGITSIGIIARIAGKRFLDVEIDRSRKTYWRRRERVEADRARSRMEKQF